MMGWKMMGWKMMGWKNDGLDIENVISFQNLSKMEVSLV